MVSELQGDRLKKEGGIALMRKEGKEMISGISGVQNTYQLQQLMQPQSANLSAAQVFGKIDTNGDGSVSKDEFTAFQTNMPIQFQNAVMGSQADSTSSLLALLQSAGQVTTGTGASTVSTASQNGGTIAAQLFGKIDTNGDGSISKDEFAKLGTTFHRSRQHGAHKAGPHKSSTLDQLFKSVDSDGDGSVSKDEMMTFLTNLGVTTNTGMLGKKLTATV
jgi:Ca2+-binding EF-hand superfamily protein